VPVQVLARRYLDDPAAVAQGDVPLRVPGDCRHVGGGGHIEAGKPAEHFAVSSITILYSRDSSSMAPL